MPFPEMMIAPMRRELTSHGFEELRTPDDVDRVLGEKSGTVLVAVNSTCGCAAARMRPALVDAIQRANQPDRLTTVFAGQDLEATQRARDYFTNEPPSSPSIAIMRDGELVYMMPRALIERRTPDVIANDLVEALNQHCG